VNRAKLRATTENNADIKALMSRQDALIDLPGVSKVAAVGWDEIKDIRAREFPEGRPLLVLYPIGRNSVPASNRGGDRVALGAVRDILGIAIVFPKLEREIPLGYLRAAIDLSRYEQAEYVEEVLIDDDAAAN
jgi:hypothetical protein